MAVWQRSLVSPIFLCCSGVQFAYWSPCLSECSSFFKLSTCAGPRFSKCSFLERILSRFSKNVRLEIKLSKLFTVLERVLPVSQIFYSTKVSKFPLERVLPVSQNSNQSSTQSSTQMLNFKFCSGILHLFNKLNT
jgi:hypothetical protein